MLAILPFGGLQLISGAERCFIGGAASGSGSFPRSDADRAAAALHDAHTILRRCFLAIQQSSPHGGSQSGSTLHILGV